MQSGIEQHLIEAQNERQADENPSGDSVRHQLTEPLIEDDEDDQINQQQNCAPYHEQPHLVDEAQVGVVSRQARRIAVQSQDEPQRDHQNVAAQEPIDRLAHHLGVFLDV